ncbi:ribonuclease R [Fusibacter tunisiensis]|uniref:Ribonuclease R n=1 Tax=Fusibacter tunisiensis TaxID=1008308 RepID=A0ABS2MNY2_9FIRM|nr:ribonuclease R [Fusibacter tunisiensis]MBM7561100.1 ribonuclease R [Fusibacter tunisiensis]
MIKEQVLEFLEANSERPYIEMDLMNALNIDPIDRSTFIAEMEKLEDEGKVIRTKKGKYALPEFFKIYVGKIQVTTRGFGFVIVENVEMLDVFIPSNSLGGAMNGDKVMVKLTKVGGPNQKSEGEVIKIVTRANTKIVGTYDESKNFGFVIPDDTKIRKDIFVSKNNTLGAKQKDKVVVEIIRYPEDRRNPEGKIIEILGQSGDPGVDILAVIRTFNLPEIFNHKVLAEAEAIAQEVAASEIERREDFRDLNVITIDGKDAKDLDDAIHIQTLPSGNYELGVHIADVTQYVKENSQLDKEALKRATSVYLLNRVIPMLPERLSNGICSLNPGVNRLVLSCVMEIDRNGDVVSHRIVEGVIKTVERMNYEDVSDILEGLEDHALKDRYGYLYEDLFSMKALADLLFQKRESRGAIDFDFAETKIMLDGAGKPIFVGEAERRVGHKLIESFMLVANETVAEHFFWLEMPFVYRIHEDPKPEKIETLNKFLHHFGYKIKGSADDIHPKAVQALLEEVEGKKEAHVISKLTLRSLKQAKYSPNNDGHFGLAAKYYCHFTSPIRRYPDLQIHRIIKEVINGQMTDTRLKNLKKIVDEVSIQSSDRERNAELAEREVDDMKMAEYMVQFIGERFAGVISTITSFGMFVELENTVEGLVRLETMDDDYYVYDESKMVLVGERTRKTYELGQEVEVVVTGADPSLRQIDFELE